MKAEILSIGTEILLGEIVDTNAAYIASRLPALGIDIYYKHVVGDNLDRLVETIGRALISEGSITESKSSILIVVGREDTGDLEAQIRGSRHAWDIRLISVDALLRLMALKEDIEDPVSLAKVQEVLLPREFTKLDGIIDLVFSAAEDIRVEATSAAAAPDDVDGDAGPKFVPVNFNEECVQRIGKHLSRPLTKRSRATFVSPDGTTMVFYSVSREHHQGGNSVYWFAFHPYQREALTTAHEAYVSFGCGSPDKVLLIPLRDFDQWLDKLWTTKRDDRFYWHVKLVEDSGRFRMLTAAGSDTIDLTAYLLGV